MGLKNILIRFKQSGPIRSSLFALLFFLIIFSLNSPGLTPRAQGDWELKGACDYRWNKVWDKPLFSIWRHKESKEFAIDLFDAQNMLHLDYRDFQCAYFQLHRDGFMLVLSRFLQNNYVGVILEKDDSTGQWDRTEIHCEMVPKTVVPNAPSAGRLSGPSWIDEMPCSPGAR